MSSRNAFTLGVVQLRSMRRSAAASSGSISSFEDLRGTLVVQVRQESTARLVLGGQLLERPRAFILQLGGDFDHALIAHLVED